MRILGMNEVWIGLVSVGALPGSDVLGEDTGAYVNALAMSSSSQNFETVVAEALNDLGLYALDFEDVEVLSGRARRFDVDKSLLDLAEELRGKGGVRFGDFHAYLSHEA